LAKIRLSRLAGSWDIHVKEPRCQQFAEEVLVGQKGVGVAMAYQCLGGMGGSRRDYGTRGKEWGLI